MAYGRRRSTSRRAPSRSRRAAPRTRRRASSPRRRSARVSGGARTIRLVIQTVSGGGAADAGKASVMPMRAMF